MGNLLPKFVKTGLLFFFEGLQVCFVNCSLDQNTFILYRPKSSEVSFSVVMVFY